jgi:hypothetical protein
MIHAIRASGVLLGLLLLTLLPFAPGRHDVLAVPISAFAQGLGLGSLLVVPVGLVWLIHGLVHRPGDPRADRVRHRYALAVLVLLALTGAFAAMLGAQWGLSLGIALGIAWATALWRVAKRSCARKTIGAGPDRAMPLLCILVPGAYLLTWVQLADPVGEFARDRAIRNSAAIVADIEAYRTARGHYPPSLESVWEDYPPFVLGVDRYHYERQGEAYNLYFEQPSLELGARWFVMYNPLDEQVMTSHDYDLLRRTDELQYRRAFAEVEDAPQPHWKSFLFD